MWECVKENGRNGKKRKSESEKNKKTSLQHKDLHLHGLGPEQSLLGLGTWGSINLHKWVKLAMISKMRFFRGGVRQRSTLWLDRPTWCGEIRVGWERHWVQRDNHVRIKISALLDMLQASLSRSGIWIWLWKCNLFRDIGNQMLGKSPNLSDTLFNRLFWSISPSTYWNLLTSGRWYVEQRNVATVRMYDSLSTISSITLSLSVTHCLTPPTPPAQNNLTLQGWEDLHSMSSWNTKINYTCSAGGHNAFVSDRWRNSFELTCHENNSFTTPTWPTCVSSMIYIELK